MASGTLVEGGGDGPRVKNRWIENKVYTRKFYKKRLKKDSQPPSSQTGVASEDGNDLSQQPQPPSTTRLDLASDDSTSLQHQHKVVAVAVELPTENGEPPTDNCSVQTSEDHVNIKVSSMSKQEIREIKQKLVDELEQVRGLLKQVEAKELQLNGYVEVAVGVVGCTEAGVGVDGDGCGEVAVGADSYSHSHSSANDVGDYGGDRIMISDVYLENGGARRTVSEVSLDNGGARRMISDVNLENGGARRTISEVSLDNGGARRTISEVSLDNAGARRTISEVSLDNGGGKRMMSDVNLDTGPARRFFPEISMDNGGERGMTSDVNLDTGAARRMVPEFSLDNGGGRRMISEFNLDNVGARRMIPEFSLDNGGGRRMIPEFSLENSGARRMIPEVNSVGKREPPRSFNQLRISVMENSHGGLSEYVDKEKRTPKANQYYQNSDFIVGKEKFPPPNKKSKMNGSKKHGRVGERDYGFGLIKHTSQVFKQSSSLLSKLMKHKHGWVFNAPVDVKGLGLHDYFLIIKHPMDLGTVKTRLNDNWYRSPREFADDVRLTFRNAMTYNPKGQDVHIMAEQLSHIFEDRWAVMETEYNLDSWFELYHEVERRTPMMNRAPLMPPGEMVRELDGVQLTPHSVKPKPVNRGSSGRSAALKKPKAKDLNKRDMTFEEKQKLSQHLISLPPEKLDNILEIMNRRNASLLQRDDAIEVDIDSVDAETLWELDRFVTNYKKSLSKYKRKAELAMQAREEAERNAQEKNQAPVMVEESKETKLDEKNMGLQPPIQEVKQQDSSSGTSSSSSSSSDSDSSSSDSDSDSSSGSDAGHSPRT